MTPQVPRLWRFLLFKAFFDTLVSANIIEVIYTRNKGDKMESFLAFLHANALPITAAILIIAYIFIVIDKIPKMTIALIGACFTILLGPLSQSPNAPHHLYFIHYIDFGVLILLISMMITVNISAKTGMFDYAAIKLIKATKGHPFWLLFVIGALTAVISAFLDNVTTVILMIPISFIIAKELSISPIPLLITEIISSNIGGTATLIGDPPNIIIGSKAGFTFMDFLLELTDIVSFIFVVSICILYYMFRKQLKTTPEQRANIQNLSTEGIIKDRQGMIRSIIVLSIIVLGFLTHDITHVSNYLIALLGASILLLFEKPEEILPHVEWNTLFFFMGLFTIIGGFEAAGGIKLIAQWVIDITNGQQSAASMLIIWVSCILSGIIDNIPYTATMAPLILQIQNTFSAEYAHPLWWSLSLGACLGGNLTIIGAAANVIVSEAAAKRGYPIKFVSYLKYGIIVTFVSLILSSGYIYLRFLRG